MSERPDPRGYLARTFERYPYARHLALLALVVAASFVIANVLQSGRDEGWVEVGTLTDLRAEGVIYLPEQGVFVVENGRNPLALSEDAQHLEGDRVLFCPTSGWFEEPSHGSKFDRTGTYADGPSSRDLSRVAVRVTADETIEVNPSQVTRAGGRGEGGPVEEPDGPFCVAGDEPAAKGPPGFFDG